MEASIYATNYDTKQEAEIQLKILLETKQFEEVQLKIKFLWRILPLSKNQ